MVRLASYTVSQRNGIRIGTGVFSKVSIFFTHFYHLQVALMKFPFTTLTSVSNQIINLIVLMTNFKLSL